MPTITKTTSTTASLEVEVDGRALSFTWLWLLDHCQSPKRFHPAAKQRLFGIFGTPPIQPARSVAVIRDGEAVQITWRDDERTFFTADFLAAVGEPATMYDVINGGQSLWSAASAANAMRIFEHNALMQSDSVLSDLLQAIRVNGLALVHDVPCDLSDTRKLVERISYIRSSIFGDIWQLRADGALADTGSTSLEIKPHTDGTYNHDAPGIMALHCLRQAASGGENVFVDGFQVAARIQAEQPEVFTLLTTVEIPGQYIGDGAYLAARRPVIRLDERGRTLQVSYNNHDRAPFSLPEPQMSALYAALGAFDGMVQSLDNQVLIGVRAGDLIVVDNWRVLHGRRAFVGERHMAGCYLNREDFESRLRMLARQPLIMSRRDAGRGIETIPAPGARSLECR
jgi:trimethyllysine dioxygenase